MSTFNPTTEREEVAYVGFREAPGLPRNVFSLARSASIVVSTVPGTLFGFNVYSNKASAQFILLFDTSAGTVSNGALPVAVFAVNATTHLPIDYGPVGRWFEQGIILANSSTDNSLTLGSADCWFDVQYI